MYTQGKRRRARHYQGEWINPKHTLTQFGDWSRPSRPLSSSYGLSAHLKRTGISDTSLCECGQADRTPDHVLQSCPIMYTERRQLTWPAGCCGARRKTSTGRLHLWHQLNWRSDLHGCRSLKKKKKGDQSKTPLSISGREVSDALNLDTLTGQSVSSVSPCPGPVKLMFQVIPVT